MCRLKLFDERSNETQSSTFDAYRELRDCIEDCTSALVSLDDHNDSHVVPSSTGREAENKSRTSSRILRCKLMYRRARARFCLCNLGNTGMGAKHRMEDYSVEDDERKLLDDAARDLLSVISIDPKEKQAGKLLTIVRAKLNDLRTSGDGSLIHESVRSIRRCVDYITANNKKEMEQDEKNHAEDRNIKSDNLEHDLKLLIGSLSSEPASSSMELGRANGVPTLFELVSLNISYAATKSKTNIRAMALHTLSSASSHDPFITEYILQNPTSFQNWMTDISNIILSMNSKDSNGQQNNNIAPVDGEAAVAGLGLFLRLATHIFTFLDETAPTTENDKDATSNIPSQSILDPAIICHACISCLSSNDLRCQRAALDLLSVYTSSDRPHDLFSTEKDNINKKINAKLNKFEEKTEAELRNMPPRVVAAYRKGTYQRNLRRRQRSKLYSSTFCTSSTTSENYKAMRTGLEVLLSLAVNAVSPSLRRQCVSTVSRLLVNISGGEVGTDSDIDDVKTLVGPILGWNKDGENNKKHTLTIEEINEDDEGKEEIHHEDQQMNQSKSNNQGDGETSVEDLTHININACRAALTSSLLLGKPELGAWALTEGWSNGDASSELRLLALSKSHPAAAISSEVVSAAASVEKARHIVTQLFHNGTLKILLSNSNSDVSSGAASAVAKLGLADKARSADEGEMFELLGVAADLLENEPENVKFNDNLKGEKNAISTEIEINNHSTSSSLHRGLEILNYLSSKTIVKEEIAHGFKSPKASCTVLERLVALSNMDESNHLGAIESFAIANIFSQLAVSLETLRREAFAGKDITSEQYDQLQALGKSKEEKEAEQKKADETEDSPDCVRERIQKMMDKNVPRAMVNLMEFGSSEKTRGQLVVGMIRFAEQESCRGIMIQQGCLSSCIKLCKEKNSTGSEKQIFLNAAHCMAKMLVTTNPSLLTVTQRMGCIKPLILLIRDTDATDLHVFESLLSITNIASVDNETKSKIISEKGIPTLSYAMFSEHDMVQRAATEAMTNLYPNPKFLKYLAEPEHLKLWVAFSTDFDENFERARAACGCLAMATQDLEIAIPLGKQNKFHEMVKCLLECGNLELMHRILTVILNLVEHGHQCKEAVLSSGAFAFCEAYVETYQKGNLAQDIKFSSFDQGLLAITIDIAKEIVKNKP
mmetsp:Transcript_3163/g.4453  ORF Transcript_3163/g.4453 Transcript_3163/m.4453 type:complete len:1169 (+) Transcript_3163:206-3712(+)